MLNKSNLDNEYLESIKGDEDSSIKKAISDLIIIGVVCGLVIFLLNLYIKWSNERR